MKRIITNISFVSVLILLGGVVYNCSKIDDLVDNISIPIPFSVPVSTDVTVPLVITDINSEVTTPEIPLNINFDAQIKEKYPSLSINNLKSAKLNLLSIDYVSSGDSTTLDVIKSAKILIKAPNLEEVVMAESLNNTSATSISFTPVADLQLLNYFKSSQNSIILKVQGREVATDIVKLKMNASFRLEVGL